MITFIKPSESGNNNKSNSSLRKINTIKKSYEWLDFKQTHCECLLLGRLMIALITNLGKTNYHKALISS